MSGGTIFQKQVVNGALANGTGDNCLIIDQNYAYQVPFSFGDNWNKIKIGMFLSFVSGDSLNGGVSFIKTEDAGGSTNDTFNWIGITRNANTKSLPLDTVNEGFVGHKSNATNLNNSSSSVLNKLILLDSTQDLFGEIGGNALAVSTFGTSTLSTGLIEDNQGNIPMLYHFTDFAGLAGGTYASPTNSGDFEGTTSETGRGFFKYVGMTFEVNNKGQADQKISLTMHSDDLSESPLFSRLSKDVSVDRLKTFINGLDEEGVQDNHTDSSNTAENQITGLVFNDGSNAHNIPDSFFFYNAMPIARPRIHAWAIKRFS